MKLPRIFKAGIFIVLSLGLAGVWTLYASARRAASSDEAERRIQQLIEDGGMSASDQRMLQALGTDALIYMIPALTRQETFLERRYAWFYSTLPGSVRHRFHEPEEPAITRANAAALVGVLGPKAKLAVPYLVDLLQDDVAASNAAVSLGAIGPDAVSALPALVQAVDRGVPFAAIALAKIGDPARAVLERNSCHGPAWQRSECALALKQISRLTHPAESHPNNVLVDELREP